MAKDDLANSLERLVRDTGQSHHQAFIETAGADPEWPLWYAEYLNAHLGAVLPNSFTRAELTYLLVMLDKKRAEEAPDEDWRVFNARYIAQVYG